MNSLKTRLVGALTVACLLAMASPAAALIIIKPVPGQPPNHPALRLTENNVEVTITDRVAEVTAEFVYQNNARMDLEGTFLFPLPDEAAVDDFSLFVNGEEITAELLDRNRARRIYEGIVRRQKDPALLEFADRQLLRASIYPITPKDGAKVRLYYTHPLPTDFGTADFVYPLSVEKLEAGSGCQVTINVNVQATKPLKTIYSPTHTVDIDQTDDHQALVQCTPKTAGQRSADFHLLMMSATDQVAANFLTCRDNEGQEYFMGMISPGLPRTDDVLPKDVVFCLDRSGSMKGEKIEQAKAALRYCLEGLNSEDRFGLVVFNSSIEEFSRSLRQASDKNKNDGADFFEKLDATSGTFIDAALETALELFEDNDRPKYLVFLTDGLPTVGERHPSVILGHVADKNRHDVRIFAWGVGYDLNAGFINDLAANERGHASYVEPGQDLEIELSHFFRKINHPVLADCKLEISGVRVTEMYPPELPDMFAGSEVIVVGRYEGGSPVNVTLTGRRGNEYEQYVFATEFTAHEDKYQFLPKLWAGRRISYLMEDMRHHGENQEVIDEVVSLSKKYGIITPYTSFLVAPERPDLISEIPDADAALRWSSRQRGGGRYGSPAPVDDTRSNIATVQLKESKLSDQAVVFDRALGKSSRRSDGDFTADEELREIVLRQQSLKTVNGKSFSFRDGFYVDADLINADAPADTIRIEKFSDAYFELLNICQECTAWFSVGERVMVLYGGVLIIIADDGEVLFRDEWKNLLK